MTADTPQPADDYKRKRAGNFTRPKSHADAAKGGTLHEVSEGTHGDCQMPSSWVGSYRGAAELCGTTHKTVRRASSDATSVSRVGTSG